MGYLKLFVLVGVIFSSRTNGLPEERVVNGTPAVAGQFPFMVYIQLLVAHTANQSMVDGSTCSSSLIKPNIILTAAHCIYNYTVFWPSPNYTLWYGHAIDAVRDVNAIIKTSINYRMKNYTVHPSYNLTDRMKAQYDIAMITFPVRFNYPNNVITLLEFPIEGPAPAVAIGFGRTKFTDVFSMRMMRYGNLTIQKRGTCHDNVVFPSKYIICAAGTFQSICVGDSGGPLIIYRNGTPYQIGVTSFGLNYSRSIPCSNSTWPQGFVSVAEHYNWINAYAKIKINPNITNHALLVHPIMSLIVYTIVIQISLNNLI